MEMEFRQILTGWIIRYLNPSDTELLRALHSRNSKLNNIYKNGD